MKRLLVALAAISSSVLGNQLPNGHITIRNAITPHMIQYKFFKTHYQPDAFKLSVNGSELKPGSALQIPKSDKNITVRYDFSFAHGLRTGAREIQLNLDTQKSEYNLEFCWNNEWRISAVGAQPQKGSLKKLAYVR